ncbi:MAG: DMT family transporter [candidate division Zixibacteria bacterium]|nr:DMT family transporter [candidate division Zixibacteria bacterium]
MIAAIYIILCIIWGTTWLGIKLGLQDAPPVWAAALRMLLAALIIFIYNYIRKNKYPAGIKNLIRVAWPGILMYAGSYTMVYIGNQFVSSQIASILFSTYVFCVILMVPFVVKTEKVTIWSIVGAIIGFAGIVVIFNGPISLNRDSLIGAVLFLIAVNCSAYATVHIKAFLKDEPIFPMLALQMALGGILMLGVALVMEDFSSFQFTAVSIGSILYLSIFGSVVCFGGYYWLLQRMDAIKVSLIAFITPIVALLAGFIVLDERLTTVDFIGAALVLSGVLIVNIKK